MSISEERVHEFMRVYKEEFKEDISLNEAREMLTRLVTLYDLLARPLPDEPPERQDVRDVV